MFQTNNLQAIESTPSKTWMWTLGAVAVLLGFMVTGTGCQGDKYYLGADARVSFSQDTLWFDTVFTSIGSASQALRIVNESPGRILLEDVTLEDGNGSEFRVNIDGIPGPSASGLVLEEGDSIYVFVEVTVDPEDVNLPFIVKDRIRVTVNGFSQYAELLAWGQDAFFHGSPGGLSTLPCNDIWSAQRPHVIYGVVGVAPDCNLTIEAGCAVHVHAGGGIYVDRGVLEVNGELGQEVTFEGDRLEPEYDDIPGQWGIQVDTLIQTEFGVAQASILGGGIWLYGSVGSTMRHAVLRNGTIGVQVDTTGNAGGAALNMENCIIHNMSGIGLLAQGAHIDGTNLLLYDCAQACAAFTVGGRYRFTHSTFANYWSDGTRSTPTVLINDHYEDASGNLQIRPLTESRFLNCVMWGNNAGLQDFDELVVDLEGNDNDLLIRGCAVEMDDFGAADWIEESSLDEAPPFADVFNRDFHIISGNSQWNGLGIPAGFPFLSTDLDGLPRVVGSAPDKGCYERQ